MAGGSARGPLEATNLNTEADWQREVLDASMDGPVVVMVGAGSCPYCHDTQDNAIAPLEAEGFAVGGQDVDFVVIDIQQIDMAAGQQPGYSPAAKVNEIVYEQEPMSRSVPQTVVYYQGERLDAKAVGAMSQEALAEFVRDTAGQDVARNQALGAVQGCSGVGTDVELSDDVQPAPQAGVPDASPEVTTCNAR